MLSRLAVALRHFAVTFLQLADVFLRFAVCDDEENAPGTSQSDAFVDFAVTLLCLAARLLPKNKLRCNATSLRRGAASLLRDAANLQRNAANLRCGAAVLRCVVCNLQAVIATRLPLPTNLQSVVTARQRQLASLR